MDEIMKSVSGILTMSILIGPIVFFILKVKKNEDRKKNVESVFRQLENANGIKITKQFFMPWKKQFEKIIVDDDDKIIYYIKINKNNFKNIEMTKINYTSILKCEVIWDTHIESVDAWASLRNRRVQEEKIHRCGIRLTLNDIRNPKIDILFDDPSRGNGIQCKTIIEEWIAVFEVILTKN